MLIRDMSLLERNKGMTIVGDVASLGPAILRAIGLVESKGNSYRLMWHLATRESSQHESVETESEPEGAPTPIPGTTLPPDFDTRLRGMKGEIQAMRHEQREMWGQLY